MRSFQFSSLAVKLALLVLVGAGAQAALGSTIFGTVYDNRRNALPNVGVELLDQYHAMKQHTATDGIGRYKFEGVTDGTWYVRVLPFRYDLDEQSQEVVIYTISQSNRPGYTSQMTDFVLVPRKGTLAAAQAEVVYAQDIPNEAKRSFELGQKAAKKGKSVDAIPAYQEAIKAFPDYFLANHFLGMAYFEQKDYEHAAVPLMKAVQINPKSGVTLYYLGYSLHKLNYHEAAIVALKEASILTPASPAIFTTLGSAQRFQRKYAEAEKSLLQAKKLMKSESAELYKELAVLYGETRQFQKGAESLEQMLKSGSYSEADTAKIKEQIKAWKSMRVAQPAKAGS